MENIIDEWISKENESVEISAKQMRCRVDECWDLKQRIKQQQALVAGMESQLDQLEAELKMWMEDAGVESADGTDCVYEIKEDPGYKAPQAIDDWIALGKYIKENYGQETYDGMFKIHAQTAKSWIRREYEAHPGLDFSIPGVPEPKPWKYVKGKKK